GCNGRKYVAVRAWDPATGVEAPLYNPRKQRWEEQFTWSADFTRIIGRTPTGRATVVRLGLNRLGICGACAGYSERSANIRRPKPRPATDLRGPQTRRKPRRPGGE